MCVFESKSLIVNHTPTSKLDRKNNHRLKKNIINLMSTITNRCICLKIRSTLIEHVSSCYFSSICWKPNTNEWFERAKSVRRGSLTKRHTFIHTAIQSTLPHSWILTFGPAQCSNYDRESYTMKSDHSRLILEILDHLGPNWTKQAISY